MKLVHTLIIALFLLPVVCGLDRQFYIKGTDSPFQAEPGENVTISFVLVNRNLESPKNTEVYVEGCPVTWYCSRGNFEYNTNGEHKENLTMIVPVTAEEKTYTYYLRLRSDFPTTRGDDRVTVIVGERMKPTPKPQPNPALEMVREIPKPEPIVEEEPEVVEEVKEEPETKVEEVVDNLERLEQDKGFKEYMTAVLIVLLVVVGIGGFRAWHSGRKKQ